ncbi:hypothetical protein IQ229_06180 [Nostoc cf. edaphicum LEGE 07299]|uniref:Uncharacterized protein n=1 Tax=Nostoc cf. edaphicum LEGE 07299 TaxID=2777974 RepID=A0ABR9TXH7_9NOSO|nr:hypothetical protein [Nostoc edaphicum]MBE9104537.1 hypothetical protein [Nostoc cf. edaphicum LEGE 07299]
MAIASVGSSFQHSARNQNPDSAPNSPRRVSFCIGSGCTFDQSYTAIAAYRGYALRTMLPFSTLEALPIERQRAEDS